MGGMLFPQHVRDRAARISLLFSASLKEDEQEDEAEGEHGDEYPKFLESVMTQLRKRRRRMRTMMMMMMMMMMTMMKKRMTIEEAKKRMIAMQRRMKLKMG